MTTTTMMTTESGQSVFGVYIGMIGIGSLEREDILVSNALSLLSEMDYLRIIYCHRRTICRLSACCLAANRILHSLY
jgi:hypothetical protein